MEAKLKKWTKKVLIEHCKKEGFKGYSKLKKKN